jgi:hypothetical protein
MTRVDGEIAWGRILLGALLLETLLLVVTIPIGEISGSPFAFSVGSRARDSHVFFAAGPLACAGVGYVVGRWVTRRVARNRLLHGILLGATAIGLYFGLITFRPGGVLLVIDEYGPLWFAVAQSFRILGCVAGATWR